MKYAELAQAKLAERRSSQCRLLRRRIYDRYNAVLAALDAGIMTAVQTIPEENRKLLTYHDSYRLLRPALRHDGDRRSAAVRFLRPSPKEVAALIDQIKAEHVPAVFGSEVFPSDCAGADRQRIGRDLYRPAPRRRSSRRSGRS